ncbi:MAG: hypothetical protein ABIQ15_02405 [Nocardioides sp.]
MLAEPVLAEPVLAEPVPAEPVLTEPAQDEPELAEPLPAGPRFVVPEPPEPEPTPVPETIWRGYVLPSITPADLAATESIPEPEAAVEVVSEPEPAPWEPEPVPYASVPEPSPAPEPARDPDPDPPTFERPSAHAEVPLGIGAALAAAAARADEHSRHPLPSTVAPTPLPAPVRPREPVFAATTKPQAPPKPDDVPAVTEFTPREGNRIIAGVLLVAALIAAAVAGYLAWYERSTATIGIGCTLFILVLVIWATRASSAPAHLKINSGHLTVQRTGTIRHFDLASKYTALEVHGRAGLPGWKVLIEQRDAAPYVIDSSMVNPRAFMKVLRYYHPEL